jgi:LacI family transcriptional regulator
MTRHLTPSPHFVSFHLFNLGWPRDDLRRNAADLRVDPNQIDSSRIIHAMPHRPTIQDLAAAAGVSVATVNRVIGGSGNVRETTMQRVLEAARTIGFYGLGALQHRVATPATRHRLGVVIQTPHRAFCDAVRQGLESAAQEARDADIQLHVEALDDLSPESVAKRMLDLGDGADALAVIVAEHPIVTEAIDRLAERGVPVVALGSPLTARAHVGYVGWDSWKVGRMAGWAIGHLCHAGGKVALLVGTHRYRSHDVAESGFRSYLREHAGEFVLLEPQSTFESDAIAREITEKLLRSHADLRGLYVSGGGIAGALAALRGSKRGERVVTIGHDLLPSTRAALLDGSLTLAISHPFRQMGRETIAALVRAKAAGPGAGGQSVLVPFELYTRENL